MPVSEKKKLSNRAWDKENMHSFACRIRKHDAEVFLEYCAANNTTPAAEIKRFIFRTIKDYTAPGTDVNDLDDIID